VVLVLVVNACVTGDKNALAAWFKTRPGSERRRRGQNTGQKVGGDGGSRATEARRRASRRGSVKERSNRSEMAAVFATRTQVAYRDGPAARAGGRSGCGERSVWSAKLVGQSAVCGAVTGRIDETMPLRRRCLVEAHDGKAPGRKRPTPPSLGRGSWDIRLLTRRIALGGARAGSCRGRRAASSRSLTRRRRGSTVNRFRRRLDSLQAIIRRSIVDREESDDLKEGRKKDLGRAEEEEAAGAA
jgi:hypothetical protein